MSNSGYEEARKAMADKETQEQGVNVGADCVVMACGAAGAINSVFKSLLTAGDEIIVPSPFFVEYRNYAMNFDAKLVEVPTKEGFSLDVSKIKAAFNEKTAAVLINSPNNPTGRIYSDSDIKELCDALKEFGDKTGRYPYLICDEPYRAITYDGKKVATVFDKYDYAVVVTSFAKNLSIPGERIGYVCVNPSCPEKEMFIAAVTFATRVCRKGYDDSKPAKTRNISLMNFSFVSCIVPSEMPAHKDNQRNYDNTCTKGKSNHPPHKNLQNIYLIDFTTSLTRLLEPFFITRGKKHILQTFMLF